LLLPPLELSEPLLLLRVKGLASAEARLFSGLLLRARCCAAGGCSSFACRSAAAAPAALLPLLSKPPGGAALTALVVALADSLNRAWRADADDDDSDCNCDDDDDVVGTEPDGCLTSDGGRGTVSCG
jgi:hypothetical protein